MRRVCKVKGCKKLVCTRGWCTAHYKRWCRHGDPLAGGTVRDGRIRKFILDAVKYKKKACLIWPFGKRSGEIIPTAQWNGERQIVSRVVCELANGPPPTPLHQAAHSCGRGKQGCVAQSHLRWATRKENEADKILHGTYQFGERNPHAKLTELDVRKIRRLSGKKLQREIAEDFGVVRQTITRILSGKDWSWLQ